MKRSAKLIAVLGSMLCSAAAPKVAAADEFFVGGSTHNWQYNGQIDMDIVLNVRRGDTITWEWIGTHSVVSGIPTQAPLGDGRFRSGNPVNNGFFSLDITLPPGTYPYFCAIHGPGGMMISTFTVVCAADWNRSRGVNSQDLFDFLADFFNAEADFNRDGTTNSQDFFDFVGAFFGAC
jgi:plastocyanin